MPIKKAKEPTPVQEFFERQMSFGSSAQGRMNNFFVRFFNEPYREFERLEREAVHAQEVPKRLQGIRGDIAKAKVEKRNEAKAEFEFGDVVLKLMQGGSEQWPIHITRENLHSLFNEEEIPHYERYLDGRYFEAISNGSRKVGVLFKVVKELLKNKKLKLELERKYSGGGHGGHFFPVLKISW